MKIILKLVKIIVITGICSLIVMGVVFYPKIAVGTKIIKTIEKWQTGVEQKNEINQPRPGEDGTSQTQVTREPAGVEIQEPQEGKGTESNIDENTATGIEKSSNNEVNKADSYFLTYNELKTLQKASWGDKLFGMMILSKLKSADIKRMLNLAGGGITSTEESEIRQLLEKALSTKEVDKIYKILQKNVERVKKEEIASK